MNMCSRLEGIIPALETAHAIHHAQKIARELGPGKNLVINISGRGDKDVEVAADALGIDAREAEVATKEPEPDTTSASEADRVSS